MADAHTNFAYASVATAPSPASSGTSLIVSAGDGAKFPAVPFNATIWPSGAQPSSANAEIVRVTTVATDTFTITRTQESSSARTVLVGDQIAATITAKTLTDAEVQTLDYVERTTNFSTTTTSTSAPDTVITGNSITLDGSTQIVVEFSCEWLQAPDASAAFIILTLWDGATPLGRIAVQRSSAVVGALNPAVAKRVITPSAGSHQYIVKARVTSGTGAISAGAGGGNDVDGPMYLMVTRA